jgi:hypothetical protein
MVALAYSSLQNTPQSLAQAPTPQADIDRKERMRQSWLAYRGLFSPALKTRPGKPDHNVISNRCEPIVNEGVSSLFGPVLKIEATREKTEAAPQSPEASPDDQETAPKVDKPQPIQKYIDGLFGDDDDKMTLLSEWATNGGVCGESFVKLIPANGNMKYPRLVTLDPQLIRKVCDPDDCKLVLAYIIEYPGNGDIQKKQITSRVDPDNTSVLAGEYDLDDTWTTYKYIRYTRGGSSGRMSAWEQVGPPEPWPYPFAPIFCCPNLPNPNESWGQPDLTPDLINQNKVLNAKQSDISSILYHHGHPKTWGKGFSAAQLEIGIDETLIIASETGMLQNLEMHSDLRSSLEFIRLIMDNMQEQSRIPTVALGRADTIPNVRSGIALKILFQPLIEKTTNKQRTYGRMIREICRAALVIEGLIKVEDFEDYPIELHWSSLVPIDDLAAAQESVILEGLGVSQSTLLSELGYDAALETRKKTVEVAKKQANTPTIATQQQPVAPGQPAGTAISGQPPTQANNAQQGGNQP